MTNLIHHFVVPLPQGEGLSWWSAVGLIRGRWVETVGFQYRFGYFLAKRLNPKPSPAGKGDRRAVDEESI